MITKLSVARVVGMMMGVWFLSSSVAHIVAGIIAKATGDPVAPKVPGDGHVEHHAETYDDMSLKNDERLLSV